MDDQMIQKLSGELSKIILEAYEQGRKDALLGQKECNKSEDRNIHKHISVFVGNDW